MCPLVNVLKTHPDDFSTVVVVTGQHREMLEQVLHVFNVVPDIDLAVMKPGQTLFSMLRGSILLKIKKVLEGGKTGCRACPWGYHDKLCCSLSLFLSANSGRSC